MVKAAAPRKKSLLDEVEEESDDAPSALKVNQDYANRFEHNKRREELHRLQAKHPELAQKIEREALHGSWKRAAGKGDAQGGSDDGEDESSSEEEDDGDIKEETEARIFDTLLRIRTKDPAIYDSSVRFFGEDEEASHEGGGGGSGDDAQGSDGPQAGGGSRKRRPLFLKDVLARQALAHGSAVSSDEEGEGSEDGEDGLGRSLPRQAYDEEQQALRSQFLSAVQAVDEGGEEEALGGLLKKRAVAQDELAASGGGKAGVKKQVQKLVDRYFSGGVNGRGEGDPSEAEANAFLRDYILNQGWKDREEGGRVPTYQEVVGDGEADGVEDEEDEAYLEQADRFEAAYNFRFEEPGGAAIVSHPRVVDDSVRRPDERRKRARDARKARQAEAAAAHEEEIKRLKNLKKKEMEDLLAKVAKVAGVAKSDTVGGGQQENKKRPKGAKASSLRLDASLLEGDFDPEEWDKRMAEMFDDQYYEGEEEDLEELLGNDAEREVEALVGPISGSEDDDVTSSSGSDGDDDGSGAEPRDRTGFKALRRKLRARGGVSGASSEEGTADGDSEGGGDGAGGKEAAEAAAASRAALSRLLEEYFKLDHEGMAGGVKTRFKYREVPSTDYGLTAEDILLAPDRELNQVVSLKKLAPYREDAGGKQRPNYKALKGLKEEVADMKAPRKAWKQSKGGRPAGGWQAGKGPRVVPVTEDGRPVLPAKAGGVQPGTEVAVPPAAAGGRAEQQPAAKKQPPVRGGKPPARAAPALDPAEARKASFAPLSLGSRPGANGAAAAGPQHKKRKGQSGEGERSEKRAKHAGGGDGSGAAQGAESTAPLKGPDGQPLSKAARKNLKRAMKRAAARQQGAQGGGIDTT